MSTDFKDIWDKAYFPLEPGVKEVPEEWYHLTRSTSVPSIFKEGLIPGKALGLTLTGQVKPKGGGVYLYSDYIDMQTQIGPWMKPGWTLLGIKLPSNIDMEVDEEITSTYGSAWIAKGTIPPSNIRIIRHY